MPVSMAETRSSYAPRTFYRPFAGLRRRGGGEVPSSLRYAVASRAERSDRVDYFLQQIEIDNFSTRRMAVETAFGRSRLFAARDNDRCGR